jgi:MFS family permease
MDPISLPPDKREHTSYKVAVLGLAAVSFACLLKVIEMPGKDLALLVAMYSFAAAVPLLVVIAMTSEIVERDRYKKISVAAMFVQLWMAIGRVAGLLGVLALLWHFQKSVAVVFTIASIAGLISYMVFGVLMNEVNPDPDAKPK